MTVQVGLIVEAESDKKVIDHLLRRLAKKGVSLNTRIAHGCGKLMSKCGAWATDLKKCGCVALLVVQDSDDRDAKELRELLEVRIANAGFGKRSVVVPVRELEAWLISDPQAISLSFKFKSDVSATASPEAHADPKKRLADLISLASQRRVTYVPNVHNERIAKHLNSTTVAKRCPSFRPLVAFAKDTLS